MFSTSHLDSRKSNNESEIFFENFFQQSFSPEYSKAALEKKPANYHEIEILALFKNFLYLSRIVRKKNVDATSIAQGLRTKERLSKLQQYKCCQESLRQYIHNLV